MGFNSAFKGLKLLKTRERAFKQFKWPRPQCVNRLSAGHYNNKGMAGDTQWHVIYNAYQYVTEIFKLNLQINYYLIS